MAKTICAVWQFAEVILPSVSAVADLPMSSFGRGPYPAPLSVKRLLKHCGAAATDHSRRTSRDNAQVTDYRDISNDAWFGARSIGPMAALPMAQGTQR